MDLTSVSRRLREVMGVFDAHNSRLWAQDNPHVIRRRGFQACFRRLCFAYDVAPAHCAEDARHWLNVAGLDLEGRLYGLLGRRI